MPVKALRQIMNHINKNSFAWFRVAFKIFTISEFNAVRQKRIIERTFPAL